MQTIRDCDSRDINNRTLRQQLPHVVCVFLSVVLFKLSFPGGSLPFLAWIVLVPVGIAIYQQHPVYVFRLIFCFATFGWLSAIWWIIPGVAEVSGSNKLIVVVFLFFFCFLYAIPYAFSAVIYSLSGWPETISGAFKGAVIWTTVCYLTPHILPGNIAHSQYKYLDIIQITELGGVPLLFFLIHLCNFLLVTSIINFNKNRTTSAIAFVSALFIPLLLTTYGGARLDTLATEQSKKKLSSLEVGIVQPNISVETRTRKDWKEKAQILSSMTRDLATKNSTLDLIVWPEIPPPISYVQFTSDTLMLDDIANTFNVAMLISGYQSGETDDPNVSPISYNVAEFIPVDRPVEAYKKQKLVPFGEYLPYENKIPLLRHLFPAASDYQAGTSSVLFSLTEDIKLIPLICYEAIFPSIIRKGVELGGHVLINPVDDAWFGESEGAEIHLALALFRTVEFRKPLIRASNSGRSVIVDHTGKILTSSELFQPAILSHQVEITGIRTVYERYGAAVPWLLLVASLLLLLHEFTRKQRGTAQGSSSHQLVNVRLSKISPYLRTTAGDE